MFPGYVLINMVMNDTVGMLFVIREGCYRIYLVPVLSQFHLLLPEIKALGITLSGNKDKNEQKEKPIIHFNGKVGEQVMVLSGAWENTVGVIKRH